MRHMTVMTLGLVLLAAPGQAQVTIEEAHAHYESREYDLAGNAYLALWDGLRGSERWHVAIRLDTIYRKQLLKADELRSAGEHAAARVEYEKVSGMERVEEHHVASARLGIGLCLEAEEEYTAARAAFEQVLAMPGAWWPDRGRARMGIARTFEAEGRADEARAAYAALIEMRNVSRFDVARAEERLAALER